MGLYDTYIMFAERYAWTPDEVDALEPDYHTELIAFIQADAYVKEKQAKEQARRQKKK